MNFESKIKVLFAYSKPHEKLQFGTLFVTSNSRIIEWDDGHVDANLDWDIIAKHIEAYQNHNQ